jgi:hypothetical protein
LRRMQNLLGNRKLPTHAESSWKLEIVFLILVTLILVILRPFPSENSE